jgi:hypothetical protein
MNDYDRLAKTPFFSRKSRLIRQEIETLIQQGYPRKDIYRKLTNEHEDIETRTIADLIAAVPRAENTDRFSPMIRGWQALLFLLIGLKLLFAIDLLLTFMGQPTLFGLTGTFSEISEPLPGLGVIGSILLLLLLTFFYGIAAWYSKHFNGFGLCLALDISLAELIIFNLMTLWIFLIVYSFLGLALQVFESILVLSLFGVSLYLKRKLMPHFGERTGAFRRLEMPNLKPVTKTDEEGRPMLG